MFKANIIHGSSWDDLLEDSEPATIKIKEGIGEKNNLYIWRYINILKKIGEMGRL